MRAGTTSASQPPIQVNEHWSSVVNMFVHRVYYVTIEDAENLELPEDMRAEDQKQKYNLEGL